MQNCSLQQQNSSVHNFRFNFKKNWVSKRFGLTRHSTSAEIENWIKAKHDGFEAAANFIGNSSIPKLRKVNLEIQKQIANAAKECWDKKQIGEKDFNNLFPTESTYL